MNFQTYLPLVTGWLLSNGVKIILIIVGAWIVKKTSALLVDRAIRKIIIPTHFASKEAEGKREDTLITVVNGSLSVVIWILTLLMILAELGIDIGPILAAAGIAGLAFGFGGQYLIRDVIAGLFIILENQYRVGDIACLDGVCGKVEHITLRTTMLRDMDGTVHYVPNGTISRSANKSQDFACVNLSVGISYDADLEKVTQVVNEVGATLAKDPAWNMHITKAPSFLRVDGFGESDVSIKITGETKPAKQWAVTGELRKRLKIAFDKEGIEIPFPQRVVHQAKKK